LDALLDPPDEPEDTYPVPARSQMEVRIFSTSYKQSATFRMTWGLLAVSVLVPSVAGLFVQHLGLRDGAMWIAYAAGLVLAMVAWLVTYDRMSAFGYPGLRDILTQRLEAEGIRPIEWGGVFVSFAPHGTIRVYEGFHEWDVGFVILTHDRMCYIGEQARFALTREQVTSVRLHPGPSGWVRCPRVEVHWCVDEREGAFLVNSSLGGKRRMSRETRSLLDRVLAWQAGLSDGVDFLPPLLPPDLGEVTSRDPASGGVIASVLWMAAFGAGGAGLFGLSFQAPTFTGWYVVAVTAFLGLLVSFPNRRRLRHKGKV
jgi:hypothetical protein